MRALGDYCGLLLFPDRLMMDRTLTSAGAVSLCGVELGIPRSVALLWGGLLAMFAFIIFSWMPNTGRGLRIIGSGWFIVCFLPISNLFPLNAPVAEHWIYLASIGFIIFLAGCIIALPRQLRAACPLVIALALCAVSIRTAIRAGDWVDLVTFYSRTIASGGGTPRIHVNLATAYGERGDYSRQERILRGTLDRYPQFLTARLGLGHCLMKQGRTAEAEHLLRDTKSFEETASHNFPDTWTAALNLARMREDANDHQTALEILNEARERFPAVWALVAAQARALEKTRAASAAIPSVQHYARMHWWHMGSHVELARLLLKDNQYDSAVAAMWHASKLDIYDPKPLANIARIELARSRPEAALAAQRIAIRRDGGRPSQFQMLANILSSLARNDEAAAAWKRAEELRALVRSN